MGWPSSLFRVFHMMLQETLKEIFGQYILSICFPKGFLSLGTSPIYEDTASSVPQQYRIFSFQHLSSLICEMVLYVLNLVAFKLSVKLNKLKGLFAICRSLINCLCPWVFLIFNYWLLRALYTFRIISICHSIYCQMFSPENVILYIPKF